MVGGVKGCFKVHTHQTSGFVSAVENPGVRAKKRSPLKRNVPRFFDVDEIDDVDTCPRFVYVCRVLRSSPPLVTL